LPRKDGISLKPHSGKMEDADIIKKNADLIRSVLARQAT